MPYRHFYLMLSQPLLKNPQKWHTKTKADTVHEPFALKAQVWSHLKADTWQFIVNLELCLVVMKKKKSSSISEMYFFIIIYLHKIILKLALYKVGIVIKFS